MERYRLRRHEDFNFSRAELFVWYTLEEYRPKAIFQRWKWRPVKEWTFAGSEDFKESVSGNLEWAQRLAKHLCIEVPGAKSAAPKEGE